MQIYIHRNNQQLGPLTEAEVKAQLASGAISPQDHVWWSGQQGWVPLGQSPLMTGGLAVPRGTSPVPSINATGQETSKLAIWALVCGCLSLLCGIFTSIPAIILGHMGLSEIKKNPTIQGRGMALAAMIIGYVFTTLIVIYLIFVFGFLAMVKPGKAIYVPLQPVQKTNSANQSETNSVPTTNTPDQSAPTPATTNSPDQSTNSAPATTNAPDQSTNSADSSTNSSTPGTNAPDSGTNAAPMNP